METSKVGAMTQREGVEDSDSTARADAFRSLADKHLDASYRLAYVILGHRAEAEDATHDAFVTAWRKWSTLRDQEVFQHWFDRILVNTCRNRLRHVARWRTQDLSPELQTMTSDDYARAHDRAQLWPALARLTPDQRVVVALRFYRDMSIDRIAAGLGVPPGTVKSRLHRGLRELRAGLGVDELKGPLP
jgi:RNA polymerase sigma-70 factor (ECF subfamily)